MIPLQSIESLRRKVGALPKSTPSDDGCHPSLEVALLQIDRQHAIRCKELESALKRDLNSRLITWIHQREALLRTQLQTAITHVREHERSAMQATLTAQRDAEVISMKQKMVEEYCSKLRDLASQRDEILRWLSDGMLAMEAAGQAMLGRMLQQGEDQAARQRVVEDEIRRKETELRELERRLQSAQVAIMHCTAQTESAAGARSELSTRRQDIQEVQPHFEAQTLLGSIKSTHKDGAVDCNEKPDRPSVSQSTAISTSNAETSTDSLEDPGEGDEHEYSLRNVEDRCSTNPQCTCSNELEDRQAWRSEALRLQEDCMRWLEVMLQQTEEQDLLLCKAIWEIRSLCEITSQIGHNSSDCWITAPDSTSQVLSCLSVAVQEAFQQADRLETWAKDAHASRKALAMTIIDLQVCGTSLVAKHAPPAATDSIDAQNRTSEASTASHGQPMSTEIAGNDLQIMRYGTSS
jgi:hypothetical protein